MSPTWQPLPSNRPGIAATRSNSPSRRPTQHSRWKGREHRAFRVPAPCLFDPDSNPDSDSEFDFDPQSQRPRSGASCCESPAPSGREVFLAASKSLSGSPSGSEARSSPRFSQAADVSRTWQPLPSNRPGTAATRASSPSRRPGQRRRWIGSEHRAFRVPAPCLFDPDGDPNSDSEFDFDLQSQQMRHPYHGAVKLPSAPRFSSGQAAAACGPCRPFPAASALTRSLPDGGCPGFFRRNGARYGDLSTMTVLLRSFGSFCLFCVIPSFPAFPKLHHSAVLSSLFTVSIGYQNDIQVFFFFTR